MKKGVQLPLDIKLREDATFANYIGEAGRRLAGLDELVLVWGEPGSGRSHLLQAACHAAASRQRSSIYLFDLAQLAPEVLQDLDDLELICLDDVQAVLGDPGWETALFHLVNAGRDRGRTLLLSADAAPRELPAALPDLASRLRGAAAVETDRLDDRQKLELLQQKANRQGFTLGDEVGRFIMNRAGRDVRTLLDLLERLERETLRRQKRVTIPFVKETLQL